MSDGKKWKNFISIWKKDSGPLQGSGVLNLEAFARVLKDQNVTSADGAREIYTVLKKHLPDMEVQVSVWLNQQKQGKQPDFQVGYNPPREPGSDDVNTFKANKDDVPF